MSGEKPAAKIVPFRGEYFELKPEAHHFCKNLIYPVPDPNFPFLGVHFTRMIDGSVECGPNAVLAFAREGYKKTDLNIADLAESLTYPGFLRMAAKYWRMGLGEMWRSVSKAAFVKALQRLVPEIRAEHLEPAPAGVRAQAVTRDGSLVDDFLIQETDRVINVGNAPSPAATASLNIGKLIAERLGPGSHDHELDAGMLTTMDSCTRGCKIATRSSGSASSRRASSSISASPRPTPGRPPTCSPTSDLRGIDSHGVARLHTYFDMLAFGRINPRPNIRVVRETPSTATVDGDNGLGLVVGPRANAIAMEKAEAVGSGWVSVSNTNHFGIAGYYPLQALKRDLIGWAMTNSTQAGRPALGRRADARDQPDRDRVPRPRGTADRDRHGDQRGRLRQDRDRPAQGAAARRRLGHRPDRCGHRTIPRG